MRFTFAAFASLVSLASLTVACGGSTGSGIDDPTNPGASSGGGPGGTSGGTSGGASSGVVTPGGPTVTLALRGSKDAVPHKDGLASQTPLKQGVAVRSFYLMKDASDPAPLKVADIGPSAVETDLVSGVTNDIATVPIKSLPAGSYTMAKVGVAYVRYTIAARLHAGGFPTDGTYDNVEALSDNAIIDGVARKKSWFKSTFVVGGKPVASTENEGAPLPALADSGGMRLETVGAESFYVFPLKISLDPDYPADMRLVVDVNVHESFRWVDQGSFGYSPKVFDTTPTTYEPVMSFGASAFKVTYEPK
ncbi:MAG: hypothetical protein JST00_24860 [Deltaproteobacteria bacterium]|nr:hypothetical protein [Deltaproteobacteria bacterium]